MFPYVIVLYSLALFTGKTFASCTINPAKHLESRTPIPLVDEKIISPNVIIDDGELVKFLCSGKNNYIVGLRHYGWGALTPATCYNKKFIIGGNPYDYDELNCKVAPQSGTQELNVFCNQNSKIIQIGFPSPYKFLPRIDVCFDQKKLITYWTRHELQPSNYVCDNTITNFKKDYFINVNPDNAYLHNKVYDKGHITPQCDFATAPERRMTFYYINTAPQVNKFNRNNWKSLEGVIRSQFKKANRSATIYTGTTGTTPDRKLDVIPIPQFFWKVVIKNENGEGIAFVGVNNVNDSVGSPCVTMRCPQWLGSLLFRISEVSKGQIYCCTIENLKEIENIQVPQFTEYHGGVLVNI